MVIGQGDAELSGRVCDSYGAWYRCLCDPDRVSYALYGLNETNLAGLMGERSKAGYRRAKKRGYAQDIGNSFDWDSDWFQLGGVAVIDRAGRLRYLRRHTDASDQARLGEVLALCRRLSQESVPGGEE